MPEALKACAIYGPNGSGKTNVIRAMTFVSDMVSNSAKRDPTEKIQFKPFAYLADSDGQPTSFEVMFVEDDNVWRFGFSATNTAVVKEWLYQRPFDTSRERQIYYRDQSSGQVSVSKLIKSYRNILEKKTSQNQLFISKLAQNNDDVTRAAFVWLAYGLRPISTLSEFPKAVTASKLVSGANRYEAEAVLNILRASGVDVDRIEVEAFEYPFSDMPKHVVGLDSVVGGGKEEDSFTLYRIKFIHKTPAGREVAIDFADESLGTHTLFALAGIIVDALQVGFVMVIDELNQSFHPEVLKVILEIFYSDEANPNKAQLIFTSHDTSVMASLERDQIWVVDKSEEMNSILYSFADFGPTRLGGPRREGAFAKQYLSNRYGGLPQINIVSAIEALVASNSDFLSRRE